VEAPKTYVLRFTTRKKRSRDSVEAVYMYDHTGSRVFHAYCSRSALTNFIERLISSNMFNAQIERSRSGKTLRLVGSGAEDVFRRVAVFAGVAQCTRSSSKIIDAADIIAGLGEFEAVFWYTKILGEFERRGFWGVCRVAKSFRTLYRID